MMFIDYARLANQHRPRDVETLRAAATELRSRGLTHRDIGIALSLATDAVARLLGDVS